MAETKAKLQEPTEDQMRFLTDGKYGTLEELIRGESQRVYNYAVRHVPGNNRADAEDLTQIVMEQVVTAMCTTYKPGNLAGFIKTVLNNRLRNCYRSEDRSPDFTELNTESRPRTTVSVDDQWEIRRGEQMELVGALTGGLWSAQLAQHWAATSRGKAAAGGAVMAPHLASLRALGIFGPEVLEAMSRVPPDHLEAFLLRDCVGMTKTEIADLKGWKYGTVGSRINRGEEAFLRALREVDTDDPRLLQLQKRLAAAEKERPAKQRGSDSKDGRTDRAAPAQGQGELPKRVGTEGVTTRAGAPISPQLALAR